MILDVKFPVLITAAALPRYGELKSILALVDTKVEIEEVEDVRAPVVVRVECRTRDIEEIRHRDGVFYKKINPDFHSLEDIVRYRHRRFAFHRFALKASGQQDVVLPKGVVNKIARGVDILSEYPKLEKLAKSMKLGEVGEAELEEARTEFHSWIANAVVAIDGELWIAVPEPMLSVDHFAAYPLELAFDDLGKKDPISDRFYRAPVGRTLYTMNQLEQAFIPKKYAPDYKDRTNVEVLDPSVFLDDVPIGDIVAQLSHISNDFSWDINVSDEAKKRLSDFVENEEDWSWDRAFDEVEYLLANVYTKSSQFTRQIIERERDRIEAKSITIPTALAMGRYGM
ncbi:hypothetical protein [Rhizobium sp. BK176]|uniref:hypothetical protein n=1 Tax=Rhizobium sp. BK176 TaxID=2587071 RepID=UPI002169290D|nr:hypothetical protein [Rhizobium sp. BK176]MCS4089158.1 hypothetical protein [Rhizobium sp. BK176]